jgi:1-phosphofructokinase family hexose kinase
MPDAARPARDVLVVGPNLTLDRTLSTDEFRPGGATVVDEVIVTAGGKGVNVARAARSLGLEATVAGLLAGHMGQAVAELLRDEGIDLLGVAVPGELRFALIVLEDGGRATVLNEPGPELADNDWNAYEAASVEALDDHAVAVCSGSLPPGAPADGYARIVSAARERGRAVIVDASGAALVEALGEGPDAVCPNLAEAEGALLGSRDEAVSAPADARDRSIAAAEALVGHGARAAIVTAAAAGVALADRENRTGRWIAAPAVTVSNPMGAGDAFAAGLAAALARGFAVDHAARYAVGVASASVEHPRAGWLDAARATALAEAMGNQM